VTRNRHVPEEEIIPTGLTRHDILCPYVPAYACARVCGTFPIEIFLKTFLTGPIDPFLPHFSPISSPFPLSLLSSFGRVTTKNFVRKCRSTHDGWYPALMLLLPPPPSPPPRTPNSLPWLRIHRCGAEETKRKAEEKRKVRWKFVGLLHDIAPFAGRSGRLRSNKGRTGPHLPVSRKEYLKATREI
jgi:hypothetical protein